MKSMFSLLGVAVLAGLAVLITTGKLSLPELGQVDNTRPAVADPREASRDRRDGFIWAQAEGVRELAVCTGRSAAFIEGCKAYVAEQLTPEAELPGD